MISSGTRANSDPDLPITDTYTAGIAGRCGNIATLSAATPCGSEDNLGGEYSSDMPKHQRIEVNNNERLLRGE